MRWLDSITDSINMKSEQTLEDSKGQGSLACCSPWGCKELDMIYRPKNNNVVLVAMKRNEKQGADKLGTGQGKSAEVAFRQSFKGADPRRAGFCELSSPSGRPGTFPRGSLWCQETLLHQRGCSLAPLNSDQAADTAEPAITNLY